jgi:hypothetical protein
VKKIYIEILTDLYVLSLSRPPDVKNWFLESCLSTWLYVYMYTLLAPEQLDGFHSCSIFMSLSVIGQCLVNMNTLAPNTGAHHLGPEHKIAIFSKMAVNKFIYTSVNDGRPIPSIKLVRWYLQESNSTHTTGQNMLYRSDRFHCCLAFGNQQWSTEQQSILLLR